jgi:catechol 2,3-dioxygenase-like lactoylglutathione lyase family enzyme
VHNGRGFAVNARVERVDHVELQVPDRTEAAAWYERVLGLKPVTRALPWAEDPWGALMLSADGTPNQTMLALFVGEPQGGALVRGLRRLAFRTSAAGFLSFVAAAPDLGVTDGGDPPTVIDHGEAFSVYFQDPYGTRLEVTTYEHAAVSSARAVP